MKIILLVHGPNLNFLGRRNPEHYGNLTLETLQKKVKAAAKKLGLVVKPFQSNHEGEIIDFIQKSAAPKGLLTGRPAKRGRAASAQGMIINPGAFTHYSFAIHDAILDAQMPTVEVHLSDINNREEWRRKSVTAPACIAQISGKKDQGYIEALELLSKKI